MILGLWMEFSGTDLAMDSFSSLLIWSSFWKYVGIFDSTFTGALS
jgi:hypothetical protein